MNVAFFSTDGGGPGGANSANVSLTIPAGNTTLYLGAQIYMTAAAYAALSGFSAGDQITMITDAFNQDGMDLNDDGSIVGYNDYSVPAGTFTADGWHLFEMFWDTSAVEVLMCFDGATAPDSAGAFTGEDITEIDIGMVSGTDEPGQDMYVGQIWVGTTPGASDILLEDWSTADFSNWTAVNNGTIVTDQPEDPPEFVPLITGSPSPPAVGRVLIAFDDGPLEPSPTWTSIDDGVAFPPQFVAGYDVHNGRQTLLSQTDTGTATVYINDHEQALFDPRNSSSPYFGKLDGRQIKLQLWDPVREEWESQFQGHIDQASYDIDGSAVDANGDPINASIQLNCVDIFDFLAGFGLTPGLDGVTPRTNPGSGNTLGAAGDIPTGGEDGVWYAATTDTVWDRIFQILMDVTNDDVWVADRAVVFSGNVSLQAVKYDPDESALQALRDACDAEFPFIANMYVDRFGRFVFHGRYGRLEPFSVAADAGVDRWDFHYWQVGDGKAIQTEPERAQMRILGFGRGRQDIINVAIAYPANMKPVNMPNQIFANTTSITDYGKHAAPPMSDLLTNEGSASPSGFTTNSRQETFLFAKFLVLGQKDPRETITALQVKSVNAEDYRAPATWALLSQADVSDLISVKVGYPGGTGFTGDTIDDDYYIEGRHMRVRPLNPVYDYVELDLEVSPYVWSADLHGVFPLRGAPGTGGTGETPDELTADFSIAL